MIGKLFEKILLARILHVVSKHGLMQDEQFRFRPKCSMSLQLACLVERITRNFGKKRLTGAVFLDIAKAFDTIWIYGLLYKLTTCLNIVHTVSSYLKGRTFEASFQTATSFCRGMRAGVAQGGLIFPVLFSLCVNDMPWPSHLVNLALYADDTAVIAMSCKPTLQHQLPGESFIEEKWLLDMWGVPTGAVTRNRLARPLWLWGCSWIKVVALGNASYETKWLC